TNPIPLNGECRLLCEQPHSPWAAASKLDLSAQFSLPSASDKVLPPSPDPSWTWWTNIAPYFLNWHCHVTSLQTTNLQADEISGTGDWRLPDLTITNFHARLYRGQLEANCSLDVLKRELRMGLASNIDPHKVAPMLTEGARRWLGDFSWQKPPEVKGEVSLILPAWTNRHPDWRVEVQPTLNLQGEFSLSQGGAYRGLPVSSAHSHLSYS